MDDILSDLLGEDWDKDDPMSQVHDFESFLTVLVNELDDDAPLYKELVEFKERFSSEDSLSLAYKYFQAKEWELANRYASEAIRLNPNNSTAHMIRATANMSLKNYKSAIEEFSKLIQLDPNNAMLYASRANTFMQEGEFIKGIRDLDNAINLKPYEPMLFYTRGVYHYFANEYDSALNDLTEAIRLGLKNPDAYKIRGDIHVSRKKVKKAIEDYTLYINSEPNNAEVYYKRSACLQEIGDTEKAIEDLNKVIKIDPRFADAYKFRAAFTQSLYHDFNITMEDLFKYLILKQTDVEPVIYEGLVTYILENEAWEKAIEVLFELFEINDIRSMEFLAALIRRGGFDLILDKLSGLFISNLHFNFTFLNLIKNNEYLDKVINTLSKLVQTNSELCLLFASALFIKEDWEGTIQKLSEFIDRYPEQSDGYYYLRSNAHKKLSNWDAALMDLNKVIDLNPDSFNLYKERAEIYLEKGFFTQVINDYEQYLELGGDEIEDRDEIVQKVLELKKTIYPSSEKDVEFISNRKGRNRELAEEHYGKGLSILNKGGGLELTINELQKAISMDPEYVNPYLAFFDIYAGIGDWERAIKYVSKAIEVDPKNPTAFNNRAGAYFNTNEFDKAIKDMETATQLDPDNFETKFNLAACYVRNEDFELIHNLLSKPGEKEIQDPRIYYYRGIAHYYQKLHQKSIENLSNYCDMGGYPGLDSVEKIRGIIDNLRKNL